MKYFIIYTLVFINGLLTGYAQEDKYKALFMYKFIQNFEWPASKNSGEYKVGVLGDNGIIDQINTLTAGRMVNNKAIKAVNYSQQESLDDYAIVFIAASEKDKLSSLSDQSVSASTVLISESPGSGKEGAFVNFIESGGKLKFEMNLSRFDKAGINVAGSIKSLAVLVQ